MGKRRKVARSKAVQLVAMTKLLQYDVESDTIFPLNDDSDDSSFHLAQVENECPVEEGVSDAITQGDYVKVMYEGEYLHGVVQAKSNNPAENPY